MKPAAAKKKYASGGPPPSTFKNSVTAPYQGDLPPGTPFYNKNNLQMWSGGNNWFGSIQNPVDNDPNAPIGFAIPPMTTGRIVNELDVRKFISKGGNFMNYSVRKGNILVTPTFGLFRYNEFNGAGFTYFVTFTGFLITDFIGNPIDNVPFFIPVPEPWSR